MDELEQGGKPIVYWPTVSCKRFGHVPGKPDKSQYRIVWAPSRYMMVGGRWADNGQTEYRFTSCYRHIGDQWIMERWLSPFEFCQMSPEMWELTEKDINTGLYRKGPYPVEGVYFHCFTFEACTPDNANVEKLINMIDRGKYTDKAKNAQFIKERHEKDKESREKECHDIIWDTMHSHLGATVGRYSQRGTKNFIEKTAKQLGLPGQGGKFVTGGNHARIVRP